MMLEFFCPFVSKVPALLSHRDRRRLSTEVVANGCLSTPIASLALSSFCRFTNFASDGYVTAHGTADQRSGEAHVFILKVAKVVELGLLLVENTLRTEQTLRTLTLTITGYICTAIPSKCAR